MPPASAASPDARLGQREARALARDHQVAGQRDLEAPARGDAVDRGDDRLGAAVALGQPREARRGCVGQLVGRGLGLEVEPGAERAVPRAGDDRDPLVRVRLELVEDLGELVAGLGVQGVEDLGPVDRHDQDAVLGVESAETSAWIAAGAAALTDRA